MSASVGERTGGGRLTIETFDLRDRSNVTGTESMSWSSQQEDDRKGKHGSRSAEGRHLREMFLLLK
jgi:hypothetical protein